MAGLIGLTASDIELQDAFGIARWTFDGDWVPHPVVRLTTTLPAAVLSEEGPAIARVRWGIPVGGGRPVGNARDDRLQDSRLWAQALGRTHAVFAATAVYEMADVGGQQTALWFRRIDGAPLLMPGLVATRRVGEQERLCGAIVTTAPNAFFGRFHDRQVCTLERDDVQAWLTADADRAMAMLRAPAVEAWEAVPIDKRIFGKGRREMEDLVPVGAPIRHGDPDPQPRQRPTLDMF